MKRFGITVLLSLLICFFSASVPLSALAQETVPVGVADAPELKPTVTTQQVNVSPTNGGPLPGSGTTALDDFVRSANANVPGLQQLDNFGNAVLTPVNSAVDAAKEAIVAPVVDAVNGAIQQVLFTFVINVFGFFVWVSGILLNNAIDFFVIGFGGTFKYSGLGIAVNNMWVIIRDFVNLGFIFGLLYIGFKMILGSDGSNTRRWLVNLIIAALLVNFSLFATKFVVDFSNQIAAEIAVEGLGAQQTGVNGKYESDISQKFFARMGITQIFARKPENGDYGYIMGIAVFLLITTFVFAAGAILLLIRFAALNLFLVLSPLMFIGWVLPFAGDQMSKYWKKFLGNCFFAPAYLLMLYFSLTVVGALQVSIGNTKNTDLANPNWNGFMGKGLAQNTDVTNSALGTLPFFFLICIFLIMSLTVAQKLGAVGADKVVNATKKYGNKTARFAGAQTAGRAARYGADRAATTASRGLTRLQSSDNRLVRGLARSNSVQGTVTAGVAAGRNARFGLSRTREQDRALSNQTNDQADRRGNVDIQVAAAVAGGDTPADITARQDARNNLANSVRQMTPQQILEIARTNPALLNNPVFAAALTDAQLTNLRGSGALTNEQAGALATTRDNGTFEEFTTTLDSATANTANLDAALLRLSQTVQSLSGDRLNDMFARQLESGQPIDARVASSLTGAQFDTLRNSGRFNAQQITDIRNARNAGLTQIARTGSLATGAGATGAGFAAGSPEATAAEAHRDRSRRALFRNAQQAGQLPAGVLSDPGSASYLTPRIIEEFMANNPNQADLISVRSNIATHLLRNPAERDAWRNWTDNRVVGRQFGLIIP